MKKNILITLCVITLQISCASPSLPPEVASNKNDTTGTLSDSSSQYDINDAALSDISSTMTTDADIFTNDTGTLQLDIKEVDTGVFCPKYGMGCPCDKNANPTKCCLWAVELYTYECKTNPFTGDSAWGGGEGCGCLTEESGYPCSSPYAEPQLRWCK